MPAQLTTHPFHTARCFAGKHLANGCRAGEGKFCDFRVGGEFLAHGFWIGSSYQIDYAWRESCPFEYLESFYCR